MSGSASARGAEAAGNKVGLLLMNPQKLTVNYEGKDYEARYSASGGTVQVEIKWGNGLGLKTERSIGDWSAEVVTRMTVLGALIGAKQRGELSREKMVPQKPT